MQMGFIVSLWCIIGVVLPSCCGQGLGKSQSNSYYYLKQNGGYEYAFNTDTGMQSAQTADQFNEVTGHYMYYDNGLPYMVKYRAGVHGFQPEIIPPEKLLNGNFHDDRTLTAFKTPDNTRVLRTTTLLQPVKNNYRLTQTQQLASTPTKVSSYSIGTDTTLKFVQDALKTMQTQPMHLSFNSGLGEVQHPAGPFAVTTTQRPPTVAPLEQPITRSEVQDINNLAPLPTAQTEEPIHPYSFNYNGDMSSRTESADQSGNVVGSYSYYDDAGFHDVSYKAGDDTGFVILGRNSQAQRQQSAQPSRQYFRPNSLDSFSYNDFRLGTNSLDERNFGKRSTRSSVINDRLGEKRSVRSSGVDERIVGKRPTRSSGTEQRYTGARSLRKFRRYSKW